MGGGFIYKWFDKGTGLIYIGKHEGEPDDGYISDSPDMLREYHKRPLDFKRIILWHSSFTCPAELKKKEDHFLALLSPPELFGGIYRQPYSYEMRTLVGGDSGDVNNCGGDTRLNGKELREILAQKRPPGCTYTEMLFAAQRKKRDGR